MHYLLANNRQYNKEHLLNLPVQEGDTVGICNFWWHEELPDWKCDYVYFVRNIYNVMTDRLPFEEMVEYIKPKKIYYIEDRPDTFLKSYADKLGIDYKMIQASYDRYPSGFPSTGFMAALQMPMAKLVGYEGNDPHYGNSVYHNFIYEHVWLEQRHEIILL